MVATDERMGVKRSQDLVAWQLANELKQKVYALADQSAARRDFRFCDQSKGSTSSAPTNIAEGFANHLGDGIDRGAIGRKT